MQSLLDADMEKLVFDPPETGCLLHLSGLPGGGSKIQDRSAYANHGSITGAAWARLPGGLWCLSYDGSDDYLSIANNSSLQLVGDATWLMWVKIDDRSVYSIIMTKSYINEFTIYVEINGSVSFRHGDGAAEYKVLTNTGVVAEGKWTLIAVVRNISTKKLYSYINGVDGGKGSVAFTKTPTASSNVVYIGVNTADTPQGSIALARIYNRALSALEISNHFNREKHLFGAW